MTLWGDMGLEGKRAIIVHQDDLGMSDAANRAYLNLGLPTGSVMLPGAWAPQMTRGDLGVHLTLTSEWHYPRMRPLTAGATLRDEYGYFWPTVESAWAHMDIGEVVAELRAQINAAYQIGIDPTHLDTHMGTILRPDIALVYHEFALEYRIPCLLTETLDSHLPPGLREPVQQMVNGSPLPKVKLVDSYPVPPTERRQWYVDTLRSLGPGVYHLIHHAAMPTPEGQMIPDWERRNADFLALQDGEVRAVLSEFTLLTYREVRDAMRLYLRLP